MIEPFQTPRKRAAALLAWYDAHRRDLPWRAGPGERADPYAVWLSEIMLQQTTVATVRGYYEAFLARWPTVEALAAAPLEDVLAAWAGLGYYARARNLHACAGRVARELGGRFPQSEAALRGLPGVGPYTAGAIAAIAFDAPSAAIDGNVERVMARLHAIAAPLRQAKPLVREKVEEMLPAARAGDFAQALMDLGATVCTPRAPNCGACPLAADCVAYRCGVAEAYPIKGKKAEKPKRRGAIFVLQRGDFALLARRPPKGLLGGMSAFPATPFDRDVPPDDWLGFAPCPAAWRALPESVAHVFTHFALSATVFVARTTSPRPLGSAGRWAALSDLDKEGLPTLMRKAAAAAGLL
ncbi:A/G-specific adenine glycosylase [Methylocystis echinoides]|uniref:A/G-specific adenine glycosylase n=1 Tax=Methylocystis echinoides TaxID=29468 RepID=UPI003434F4ED